MQISDELLIAYLLGDANPQDRKRIEMQLAEDRPLRDRLSQMRILLGQLDALQCTYEPPIDLLSSTMASIDQAAAAESQPTPVLNSTNGMSVALESRFQRPIWDSTALVLCVTVLLCLFLPTVLRARFESRKAQCSHRLQFLGRGLIELASFDPQQRFPAVALDGPLSFAGIYAVRLSDFGLLDSPSQLKCASLEGCRPVRGELHRIPTLAQLKAFDVPQLELCRSSAGGDYAFSLGVLEDNKILPPRYEGRTNIAVLADSPTFLNGREELLAHDGRGLNIFFEDGRVTFVAAECWEAEIGDNPFCNIKHAHEVGLHKLDASLGPSHFSPLGNE